MRKNKCKIAAVVIITFAILIIAFLAFARPFRIAGDCMEPAVKDGQLCFLNRISPWLRPYQIGDIAVFKYEDKPWLARVVALETNTIQITEGSVIVNDVVSQDAGIQRDWFGWKYGTYGIDKPLLVPPSHIFVLSDKLSAHHDDSRVFGPVSKEDSLGFLWGCF